MKRPIGVSILAVFFVGLAVYWLLSGVGTVIAALDDTATQAGGLFELLVAFLCAALGFGLWDLEEDALRAAIALFALPFAFCLVGVISACYEPASLDDLIPAMMFLLFAASPAAYLMRPRIKHTFDQLVVVHLKG